jgi:hypothetical protein
VLGKENAQGETLSVRGESVAGGVKDASASVIDAPNGVKG